MTIQSNFLPYFQDLASELRSGLGEDWDCVIDALLKSKATGSAKLLHDALEVDQSCHTCVGVREVLK